jgi:methionyl-tRNA synthetase
MFNHEHLLDVAIIAPPPTPNGDLHIGHLSGPYFGADVLRRWLTLRGRSVISALSVDLNQSYVVTTAERLRTNAQVLADKSHREVVETLELAKIGFDVVGMPEKIYSVYVSDWFKRLYDSGVLAFRKRLVPFDTKRERFLFESYASGWCPVCLASTNGNICEACGHPNDACNLLGLYPTGGTPTDVIELREVGEYILDLETQREQLEHHLKTVIPETRPGLSRLITELFRNKLPEFPITFPSNWGIVAPFPNAEGLVLNVWAEMVPGHYHWLNHAANKCGQETTFVDTQKKADYVQFLGFDNSFFYVFAHLALALSAKSVGIEALLPSVFITNEFYLLDNFKFSTSQGHLIWGRDLLSKVSVEELRFYLAWSNPEHNQTNFTQDDFEQVVEAKLRRPLEQAHTILSATFKGGAAHSVYAKSIIKRFESAYDYRRFGLRIAAQTIANGLALVSKLHEQNAPIEEIGAICTAVAIGMSPLMPESAQALWYASGAVGALRWPEQKL